MSISKSDKSIEISQNKDIFEDILGLKDYGPNKDTFEDILEEYDMNASYPNEVYTDLMILITKHKLSNTTGYIIIQFFNKYINLNISSLPKSIEKEHKYM